MNKNGVSFHAVAFSWSSGAPSNIRKPGDSAGILQTVRGASYHFITPS